jgi:hypothetical protein
MILKKYFNEKCETIVEWLNNETYRQNYNVEANILEGQIKKREVE